MAFGPFGENRLFSDEAMATIGGALMQEVLGAFISTSGFIVVVRNFPVALCPAYRETAQR